MILFFCGSHIELVGTTTTRPTPHPIPKSQHQFDRKKKIMQICNSFRKRFAQMKENRRKEMWWRCASGKHIHSIVHHRSELCEWVLNEWDGGASACELRRDLWILINQSKRRERDLRDIWRGDTTIWAPTPSSSSYIYFFFFVWLHDMCQCIWWKKCVAMYRFVASSTGERTHNVQIVN